MYVRNTVVGQAQDRKFYLKRDKRKELTGS